MLVNLTRRAQRYCPNQLADKWTHEDLQAQGLRFGPWGTAVFLSASNDYASTSPFAYSDDFCLLLDSGTTSRRTDSRAYI